MFSSVAVSARRDANRRRRSRCRMMLIARMPIVATPPAATWRARLRRYPANNSSAAAPRTGLVADCRALRSVSRYSRHKLTPRVVHSTTSVAPRSRQWTSDRWPAQVPNLPLGVIAPLVITCSPSWPPHARCVSYLSAVFLSCSLTGAPRPGGGRRKAAFWPRIAAAIIRVRGLGGAAVVAAVTAQALTRSRWEMPPGRGRPAPSGRRSARGPPDAYRRRLPTSPPQWLPHHCR
jgi:hypothetical protein